MKVYLDTSVLNRIFDDQSQPRIYLEATSMLIIFMLIEYKSVDYFITCDDRIIKRYKGLPKIKNPIDFIVNILKEEEN